jgi:hypothetical protein
MKVLGLDVSSSITGFSIIEDGKLVSVQCFKTTNKKKFSSLNVIADGFMKILEDIHKEHKIDFIYIESALLSGKKGQTSANTLAVLSKVNALATYCCYRVFKFEPTHSGASTMRANLNIKVPKGENTKQIVLDAIVSLYADFPTVTHTKKGNTESKFYDMADATVAATYGYNVENERKNNDP